MILGEVDNGRPATPRILKRAASAEISEIGKRECTVGVSSIARRVVTGFNCQAGPDEMLLDRCYIQIVSQLGFPELVNGGNLRTTAGKGIEDLNSWCVGEGIDCRLPPGSLETQFIKEFLAYCS